MLTGSAADSAEPLEQSGSLPAWLSDWVRTSWRDAGEALGAFAPPL